MAWAIFSRTIHMNGAQRTPKSRFGFMASASVKPQEFPQDFIDYAVSKGAATKVPSPNREAKRVLKRSVQA